MKGLGLGLSIGLNVVLLVVFLFLSERCGASQPERVCGCFRTNENSWSDKTYGILVFVNHD